jgi:hypothetical protein
MGWRFERVTSAGGLAMNSVKEDVMRMIQALPDDCTLEQIQYHL